MGVVRAVAMVSLSLGLGVLIGAPAGAPAAPAGERAEALPGAIEPQPVNQKLEEEFWAHVEEHRRRGAAAAAPREAWEAHLVPALAAGSVGWCAVIEASPGRSARCPVTPLEGPNILYEAWEGGPSETRGFAITAGRVGAVTVDGATTAVAIEPITGLTVRLGAALVTIPAPFPGFWPDEVDGVVAGLVGSPHSGWGAPPLTPSLDLPAVAWRSPGTQPAGPCAIQARALPGLRARAGHVVPVLSPLAGIAGRGFLSCADTEYSFRGAALEAAILLDAAAPRATPVPLPDARRLHRHPGLYWCKGLRGQILGHRIAHGWLLIEGGSAAARERVLGHLRALVSL